MHNHSLSELTQDYLSAKRIEEAIVEEEEDQELLRQERLEEECNDILRKSNRKYEDPRNLPHA